MSELTDKQKAFCREYIKDWNGKEVAIRAGYNPNSAKVTACRMLTQPNCKAEIARLKADIERKTDIQVEEIIADLRWAVAQAKKQGKLADLNRSLELFRPIQELMV